MDRFDPGRLLRFPADACRSRGQYLFIPRWFSVSLLYYNRKLFDDAHEPYPSADWTWDEYIDSAKRLTRTGPDGRTVVWGSHIISGWWGEWLTLVRQSGGDLFDSAVTRCLLDALEGKARRSTAGVVTLDEAVSYVKQSVSKLTQGGQTPTAAPDDLLRCRRKSAMARTPSPARHLRRSFGEPRTRVCSPEMSSLRMTMPPALSFHAIESFLKQLQI